MQHNMALNWGDPKSAATITTAVHTFSQGGGFEQLLDDGLDYNDFVENEYTIARYDEVIDLLASYVTAPEEIVNCYLRTGLPIIYHEELRRLYNRIESVEFAKFLGWDIKKFNAEIKDYLPSIQVTSNGPLWTVGQAEEYKWRRLYGHVEKEYNFKPVFDAEWETRLNSISNRDVKEAYFNDYVIELMTHILFNDKSWPLEKKLKVGNILVSTSRFLPDWQHYLGGIYVQNEDWANAKIHLEEAKKITEYGGNPNSFDLFYVFTLIQLAYVYQKLRMDVTLSEKLIQKVKEISDLEEGSAIEWRLCEVFKAFEEGPEVFIQWLDDNRDEYLYFD
ncbi:hypothetical protein [Marinicrinis lubricantis]|uniref:DUF4034 domain-containing protein n=1 Tax=Marinicrinis lubricantis TaxID=2086470 RepID=A0ABW1IN25_9BACL